MQILDSFEFAEKQTADPVPPSPSKIPPPRDSAPAAPMHSRIVASLRSGQPQATCRPRRTPSPPRCDERTSLRPTHLEIECGERESATFSRTEKPDSSKPPAHR